ncbi:guanylate kinase [Candidatus Sumerlaeota bacterium]|nr:guanylate kinase [Candidatus Sumerlaeota bacterium]
MIEFELRQHRLLVVVSGPSGCGKTAVTQALLAADPSLGYSVSTTTRRPRAGEVEGRAYNFVSREQFEQLIKQGEFLEWAEVYGNLYGTRRSLVQQLLDSGRDVLLDVDNQGAMSIRRSSPNAVLVFLLPPSMKALEARLRGRALDSEEQMASRLRAACDEMEEAGRFDYLVVNDRLDNAVATIRSIIAAERCRAPHRALLIGPPLADARGSVAEESSKRRVVPQQFAPAVVFASPAMASLLERARRVSQTDSPVLLLGESGTGKEMVAEAIHRASPRAQGPLVRVNCGAIPPTLLESELFGHVRGAFTGAVRDYDGLFRAADRGTIFLDEIAELSPDLQVKLLRVLQDGEIRPVGGAQTLRVDVRLIAATNRNLAAEVAAGRFREDLFHRLNVVQLLLPPLRDRREDIAALASHFLRRLAASGRPPKSLTAEAMDLLSKYDWPGNVRQLENAIEHAVVLSRADEISPNDLPESVRRAAVTPPPRRTAEPPATTLRDAEIQLIRQALEKAGHNLTRAARILGITRRKLTYRVERFAIEAQRHRGRPKRL